MAQGAVIRKLREEAIETDGLNPANGTNIPAYGKITYDQPYACSGNDLIYYDLAVSIAGGGVLKLAIIGTDPRLTTTTSGYVFTYNTAAYTALGINEPVAIKFIYNGQAQQVNESYTYNTDGSVKTIIFDFGGTFPDPTKIRVRFLNF